MPSGVATPAAIIGRIVKGALPDEPVCWSEYLQRDGAHLVWTKDRDEAHFYDSYCGADRRAIALTAREGFTIFAIHIQKPIPHRPIPDPMPTPPRLTSRRLAELAREAYHE